MSKLDKFPDAPRPQGRTAHDMSHDFKFTMANGMLLPVEHDILLPSDTVYLKFHYFGRNQFPFLAPAMVDIDFHTDYFFVPMQMLWTPFGSFIEGVNDTFSSHFYSISNSLGSPKTQLINLPLVNYTYLRNYVYDNRRSYYINPRSLSDTHILPEVLGRNYARLMDMFGFNPEVSTTSYLNPPSFPYQFLAYQAIYQNYFRLDDREKFDPTTFNLDRYVDSISSGNPVLPQSVAADEFMGTFLLRYRPQYFDYFSSVKASPLLHDVNMLATLDNSEFVGFNDFCFKLGLEDGNVGPSFNPDHLTPSYSQSFSFDDSIKNVEFTSNSVNDLRSAFALDKLLSVTARARKNYDSQILAHFGFKVPHDVKHEISHLGHEVSTMHIGQVMSLAETDNASLGTRSGDGTVSQKSKGIKFTAPCHGVLMIIFSSAVRYDYEVPYLRRNFVQSRLDLFVPEYDHLGMQPVFAIETFPVITGTTATNHNYLPADRAFTIQGWQYRYSQFKRGINRLSHAFSPDANELMPNAGQTLNSYVAYRKPFNGNVFGVRFDSEFGWEVGNFQYSQQEANFQSLPTDTNNLFSVEYQTSWPSVDTGVYPWMLYVNDPFLIASRIEYKKVSIMSAYSMPKLD